MKNIDRLPIGNGYEDINTVVLQISKNEEAGMYQIQDELKKLEHDIKLGDFSNIGLIPSFLQAVLVGLLCITGELNRSDKFFFIARCILIQIQNLTHKGALSEVLSFLNDNKPILKEVELYGSNNINILKVLSNIKIKEIKVLIESNKDIEDSLSSALDTLRLFCISSEVENDKLAANLYMTELADILSLNGKIAEAVKVYKELFDIFPLDSFTDTKLRDAATLAFGHYVQAVVNDNSITNEEKESFCLQEIKLFQQIALSNKTAKSYFDLAIACAHAANLYFDLNNIEESANWVLKKFKLISYAINLNANSNPDTDATNERLSQSFINSCQNLINCALLSDREIKISYISSALLILIEILDNYDDDIRLYSYANAFADELFKEYELSDEKESAEAYLLFKMRTVFELLDKFPEDQALYQELQNTLIMGNPFVRTNWNTLDDEIRTIWQRCIDAHILD